MEMRTELLQGECPFDRHAVVHDVQVGSLEVDYPATGRIRQPGGADVPLRGYDPVEDPCTGGNLGDLERDDLSYPSGDSRAGRRR